LWDSFSCLLGIRLGSGEKERKKKEKKAFGVQSSLIVPQFQSNKFNLFTVSSSTADEPGPMRLLD
jgi:hypothetical protein